MDEQPREPNPPKRPRKGQFGSSQPNPTGVGGVKSRRTILMAALKKGVYQNNDWLERLGELRDQHGLSAKDQLALLRIATDPDYFFLRGDYLSKGLKRVDVLEAEIEAAKNPIVVEPAKLADILQRIAATSEPQSDPEPATDKTPESPAEIVKPAAEETPTWFEQMTGKGTNWQWPTLDPPKAEKPIPPSKFERVTLRPVVDGYESALPGENRILTPAPTGSVMAAFIRNRKIEFVETGHSGNTVLGKIVVSSPSVGGQTFSSVRQSHFKTWQENNFSDETVPADMREDWKLYLRSVDSTLIPSVHSTRPTIEPFLDSGRPNPRPVNYPSGIRKARKWGTKVDDAKSRGTRHTFGENPGADLAALYSECDRRPGTDL